MNGIRCQGCKQYVSGPLLKHLENFHQETYAWIEELNKQAIKAAESMGY